MYLFCSVLFCLFAVSSSSTVLITGASSGFGRVSALDWAAKGYNVAVCARRTDLLASVVQEIQAAGGKAVSAVCDVTKPESLAGAFAAAEQAFGTVDYVFANAGYEGPTNKANGDIDPKEVLRVFEVNVLGSYYTFVEALKSFSKPPQRDTAFVVVGSGAGSVPYDFGSLVATFPGGVAPLSPYPTAYSMSKSAIETLVRVAAGALGNATTRVVGINPYAFETDMLIKVAESFNLPAAATQGFNPIFKRLGNPRDIAVAVEAIWNNTSGWVHGDIFLIDNDATWSVQENYDKMLKGAFPPTPKRSRVFDVTGTKPYPFAEPEELYAESIAASLRSQRDKTARKEQERKDKEAKGAKKAQEKADKAEQKAKKVKQPKGEEKKEQGQAAPQEEL